MLRDRYVGVTLNLFGQTRHEVFVLPTLTIREFIQEILVEFGTELLFIDQHRVDAYLLRVEGSDSPLWPKLTVKEVGIDPVLHLEEKLRDPPQGSTVLQPPLYFRYRSHVFKIGWQPALIGRPEPESRRNRFLAVDLEPFSLSVSRQHAEILSDEDQYFVRQLSRNPTLLNGEALPFDDAQPTRSPKALIKPGDHLHLVRSGITLVCLEGGPQ